MKKKEEVFFDNPELERLDQKVQPVLRKLKRMEKAGKFKID